MPSLRVSLLRVSASWLFCLLAACSGPTSTTSSTSSTPMPSPTPKPAPSPSTQVSTATLGGGCFWCLEAVFQRVRGVSKVVSGYAGGHVDNPTYKQICQGDTGHAEVIQITFDPAVVSFENLLEVFWDIHDPTTLNRQGADEGTQYRSVIYYANDAEKALILASRDRANPAWGGKIVTEISPLPAFYPAEDYHQDYYRKNPSAGYCRVVIKPKIDKLKKELAK
jgi:peptide-methionine (S)-S-oxide reductase